MTPEEKAVIEAAMADRNTLPRVFDTSRLSKAVDALIYSCPECNAGGHTCLGDGNPIGHTANDCGEHDERTASTYPCWECLTDPTEDPITWCDDRPEDFGVPWNPIHQCRLRAHAPEKCLNRPEPQWTETTMGNCLINDRIRIGADQATVLRSNRGIWNVDARDHWEPKVWKHEEFRMELDVVPGFKQYPAGASIEILCTPDRLAVLRIQEGFPGSVVIS